MLHALLTVKLEKSLEVTACLERVCVLRDVYVPVNTNTMHISYFDNWLMRYFERNVEPYTMSIDEGDMS